MIRFPLTLKLVTFNIACGYLFTTNRRERMRAIGQLLKELDPDIVGIQEAFTRRDRDVLLHAIAGSRLQYRAEFPGGVVGNGMLTLSAHPIVERSFHRYRHSNPWYKIHQGDWWAGKGVGLTRIGLASGDSLDFYNTHTQPDRGDPANQDVRFGQIVELAAFVNRTHRADTPAFVVGDFNTGMGCADLNHAMTEAELTLAMTVQARIDFIFAVQHPGLQMEILDTQEIAGATQGRHSALFLNRAPTPTEFWRMSFGPGEMSALSDHPGYVSTVRLLPQSEVGSERISL